MEQSRRRQWLLTAGYALLGMALALLLSWYLDRHDAEQSKGRRRLPPAQSWEIVPFPPCDPGTPELAEAVRRLATLSDALWAAAREQAPATADPAAWPWLRHEQEFAAWREARCAGGDTELFRTPWGTPVEYVFTDGHHSFTLNAYDTAGVLAVTYVGGASHRVGPVIYRAPANQRTPVGSVTDNCLWNREAHASPVCHLVADALREQCGTRIALLNFLAVRAHLPRGVVTREHLAYVLPFDNACAVVEMTGAELMQELEASLAAGMPLTVSGLRCDGGDYLLDNGARLEPERVYAVALPDYVARGGQFGDYASFARYPRGEAPASSRRVAPATLLDAVAAYLQRHTPVTPDTTPRLGGRSGQ